MSQSRLIEHRIGAKASNLGLDGVIAGLAGRQHGVVGRAQLLEAGVSRRAIARRIEAGRLLPLYRGVYAVGHSVVSQRGRWMAATLATDGVLSHRSAAALWGIRAWDGRIEITTRWAKANRPGLILHRGVLPDDEVTVHDGISVTTPARTQLDIAGVLHRHQLQQAMNEAERQRLDGPHHLAERHPTKRGTKALRTLAPHVYTRSDLEARFLAFLYDRRFPTPQSNILLESYEVDFAWPDRKLIIELDGFETHSTRAAFEADRKRDRHLASRGWTVLRVTWRDLDELDRLAAELAAFL